MEEGEGEVTQMKEQIEPKEELLGLVSTVHRLGFFMFSSASELLWMSCSLHRGCKAEVHILIPNSHAATFIFSSVQGVIMHRRLRVMIESRERMQ